MLKHSKRTGYTTLYMINLPCAVFIVPAVVFALGLAFVVMKIKKAMSKK